MAFIREIEELYCSGRYDLETIASVYKTGAAALDRGDTRLSENDAWFIANCGYALDLFYFKAFIEPDGSRTGISEILACGALAAFRDILDPKKHCIDPVPLTKKLAAALFFNIYNTMFDKGTLAGFYVDDQHTQVNITAAGAEPFAVDTTVLARNIVNEALLVNGESSPAVRFDMETVNMLISRELERKRAVDAGAYSFVSGAA